MKKIGNTTWEEVFAGWAESEENNPAWKECATAKKGWADWRSWRGHTAAQLKLADRNWALYEFDDPISEIPSLLVGPFTSWQARLRTSNQETFQDLLASPENLIWADDYDVIKQIRDNLPFDTTVIGLQRADTGQIVLVEGHHRVTAIALSSVKEDEVDFTKTRVRIALATLEESELHLLDNALRQGSANPN